MQRCIAMHDRRDFEHPLFRCVSVRLGRFSWECRGFQGLAGGTTNRACLRSNQVRNLLHNFRRLDSVYCHCLGLVVTISDRNAACEAIAASEKACKCCKRSFGPLTCICDTSSVVTVTPSTNQYLENLRSVVCDQSDQASHSRLATRLKKIAG